MDTQKKPCTPAAVYRGFKPLACVDGMPYFYRRGSLYALGTQGMKPVMTVRAPSWKDGSRLVVRLLRREPKYAVNIPGSGLLLAGERKLTLADPAAGTCRELATVRQGFSDPLNILPTQGRWLAVWGDYGGNAGHEAVNLYGLARDGQVETLYTFRPGQIRHVHNIIHRLAGGYYIFTGDQEAEAGIYQADADFRTVTPVAVGKQTYRVVIGFDTPQGLLCATDAVNEPNCIFLLDAAGHTKKLYDMNGSCIYGRQFGDRYLFSTAVEPDENDHSPLSWFTARRGRGILSNEVCLVHVDRELRASTLLQYKKDLWPMKLMQYGSIQFIRGDSDDIWLWPVAVQKYDGTAIRLENARKYNENVCQAASL